MYWAVATTHPQAERKALDNLQRQGFLCYAPRGKGMRVHRGRKRPFVFYLFPRYVFVWIEQQWHSINGTFGISQVLTNERGVPSRLPSQWVDTMRAQEKDGVIVLPQERYRIGQPVQITGGLFTGLVGLYQGMSSRQREIVLLSALGKVELAAGDLI